MSEYCDPIALRGRMSALDTEKASYLAVLEEIERFITPFGGAGRADRTSSIVWKRSEVWDFTAIDGAVKLAASIQGTVTSPAIRWFRLTFRDKELMKDAESVAWLDEVSDRVYDALQDSDFNVEMASAYIDWVAAGNMAMFVEPKDELKWKGLDFTSFSIRDVLFEEYPDGTMMRFYRKLKWTAAQVVAKCLKDDVPCPPRIAKMAETPEGAVTPIAVCFAIYRREDIAEGKEEILPPEKRPWGFTYFTEAEGEQIGKEGGFYEMPASVTPYMRTTGSSWGFGPGIVALPTVRYLNAVMEQYKTANALALDPPLAGIESGIRGRVDRTPGGFTLVSSKDDIFPLTAAMAVRFDVAQADVDDLRAQIRSLFHLDDLQLKDSPAMTATEVQVRYELMNRVLGSPLVRLQSGALSPLIRTVLRIMGRAGQLPKPPAKVEKAGGAASIEYQGPLARAQRTDEVAAIERLAAYVFGLAKYFPDVLDIFDPADTVRNIATRLGVPADCIATEQEVKEKKAARERLQARLAEAEATRAEGEALEQQAAAATASVAVPPTPVVTPPFPPPGVGRGAVPPGGGLP